MGLLEFPSGSLSTFKRIEGDSSDGIKGHPLLFLPQVFITSFALHPSFPFLLYLGF